jgi:hypothetical protein
MLTRADYDRSTYAKATADKLPHGVAPLPSLAADSCSSGSWAEFIFNETNDSCLLPL